MFLRKRDTKAVAFYGVAMSFILIGSAILAIAVAQWLLNYFADYGYILPVSKAFGGMILLAFGYIILQLELLRTSK